jgi:parvulin-like peptidyl-prolyl isomerase
MKRIFLCLVVLALVAAAGCRGQVVARVNGQIITKSKLVDSMISSPLAQSSLQRLIFEALLGQEAKRRGVKVTAQDVEQAVKEQKAVMGANAWKAITDRDPSYEQTLKQNMRPQILLRKLVVDDKATREYFDKNREKFDKPARVTYRRIVLKSKQEADDVRQLLVSGKGKMEDLVKERSVDTLTKDKGGLIEDQPVSPSSMLSGPYAESAKVLEALPEGQYSAVLPNPFPKDSYQIMEVVKRTPGQKVKYEDVRTGVLMQAAQDRVQELQKMFDELQSKATIEVVDPRFQTVAQYFKTVKEKKPMVEAPPAEAPSAKPTPPPQQAPAAGQVKSSE